MFNEPVNMVIDYPDIYYRDLPEDLRIAIKSMAWLLMKDIGMILNKPEILEWHYKNNEHNINKIIRRHVEDLFYTIEDIVLVDIRSKVDAIRTGVLHEYELLSVIEEDANLRDMLEHEGTLYLQSVVHISLNNKNIMSTVIGNPGNQVRQVYDYLKVTFVSQ